MVKKQLELIYPVNLIKEPLIYQMVKTIDVIFNIRRAKVTQKVGEIVLELEAPTEEIIQKAEQFLISKGVEVEHIGGSAVES